MDEKLLAELANIKSGLETKTAQEVKSAIDAFETKLYASNKNQFEAELFHIFLGITSLLIVHLIKN